jgi:aspartyl-tRNA(Asn)/glutamyl-tRNA(Gln) amidotransferase subunit A
MNNIREHIAKVRSGEIDIVEATHKAIEDTRKINKEYNYMNVISEALAIKQAESLKKHPTGRLAGVFISVKDSIVVKNIETRGGSKILEGYIPPFNSTAVQKVIDEGAIIIGKTSQDEFGFGGFATNAGIGFKIPLNPFDKERATGGSSGGAGGMSQLAPFPHISLGESTGGSIVNPASFCGVYGLSPSYGRVSRYGLLDYGNSLDKVGPMGKDLFGIASVQKIISGYDVKDSTSLNSPVEDYNSYLEKDVKGMSFGVIKETFGDGIDKSVEKGYGME